MIMNLTQFEWIKTELKRIFYSQNKFSGNLVISENVFYIGSSCFTFYKLKIVFRQSVKDGGFIPKNRRDSLAKYRSKSYLLFSAVDSRSYGGD